MYEKKSIKPWIDLAEAIIMLAERDVVKHDKKDAQVFLESQWCNYLRYNINSFYHKNNYVKQTTTNNIV